VRHISATAARTLRVFVAAAKGGCHHMLSFCGHRLTVPAQRAAQLV